MAHFTSLQHYLVQVDGALKQQDGHSLAEFVSLGHPHVQNPNLQVNFESQCQVYLDSPFDEMFAAHIRCAQDIGDGNLHNAFACQMVVVQSFLKAFQAQKEENWALPVLNQVILDLRLLGTKAEARPVSGNQRKEGELLERAAEQMMSCFRMCVSDTRVSREDSKRWGTLAIVNQLFKIYFKINKLHLCKPLIRAIESSDLKNEFCISHRVTYKYFVGRKAMFDSEFKSAAESLEFSFNHCLAASRRNKRLILVYLIPVKMLMGQIPSPVLLQKYGLHQFTDVAQAVCSGNLLRFTESLERHQAFFIRTGIYFILEKLKTVVLRNLFKKVWLLKATHQLSLQSFEAAMLFNKEEDVDLDEVECILANLIDKGYIKGYISHQHQKLVVSKANAFPPLAQMFK